MGPARLKGEKRMEEFVDLKENGWVYPELAYEQ